MVDSTPPKSERSRWPVWKVVILVATGILLILGVLVAALFVGSGETEASPEVSSAANPDLAASPTPSSSPATSISQASTSTTEAIISTSPPPTDEDPFVGRWTATALDGSQLYLRVDSEGAFMHWDSASRDCRDQGFAHSPETWAGSATVELTDQPSFIDDMVGEGANLVPTLTIAGPVVCYPYDLESGGVGDRTLSFFYDQSRDALEPAGSGVRYTRSAPAGTVAADADNPLVGSWEATDQDGTRVVMSILADGSWESTDTRAVICEAQGFTYARWSAEGSGSFDLVSVPVLELTPTAYCYLSDDKQVPQDTRVSLRFEYEEASDTVVLSEQGVVYTRLR